jgi:hypothetical protein
MLYEIPVYNLKKGCLHNSDRKYLILDHSCLLKQFKDLDIDHLQVRHLEPKIFPEYFYAKLVIFKGGEMSRVMKSPIKIERLIYTEMIDDVITYVSEQYELIRHKVL